MTPTPERAAVTCAIYRPSDASEMARLLAETFSRRDPPALAVGLTSSEFEGMVRLFCPRAGDEGLTIVARAAATGEMAGVLLSEDSASGSPDGLDRLTAKFDPIFDILGQLETEYRGGRPPPPREYLHLFLLGVAERFAGQGVARRLVTACLENGMRNGYRVAVTEATNPTSQHIFRRQGFVERVRRSYGDHRFGGRAVFASIAEQGGPILMDRQLTPEVR